MKGLYLFNAGNLRVVSGDSRLGIDRFSGRARDLRNPGEGRPRQRRLAARSLGRYNKVGDVQVAQGDSRGAEILPRRPRHSERLAQADPGNAGWQRDLSVSYNRVGDVQVAQGDLPAALKSYRDSLAIAERLAQADPGNAGWQRDLSVSYNKVGDVLMAQGNLRGGAESLPRQPRHRRAAGAGRSRQRRLAARSVGCYDRVGNVLMAQGDLRGGAQGLPRQPRHLGRLARPTPAMPSGSAICRSSTTRSATCWWRRATCRRARNPTATASPSRERLAPPIPATPGGSAICRSRTTGSATCWWRRATSRRR